MLFGCSSYQFSYNFFYQPINLYLNRISFYTRVTTFDRKFMKIIEEHPEKLRILTRVLESNFSSLLGLGKGFKSFLNSFKIFKVKKEL